MRLYDKLKERGLVIDYKDFSNLIWIRAIRINNKVVEDPKLEITEEDKDIKVGILSLE